MRTVRILRPALALNGVLLALCAAGTGAARAAPAAATQAQGEPAQTPSTTGQGQGRGLIGEKGGLAAWAHPEGRGPIYVRPDTRSRRLARVRLFNADGFLEVYPLLRGYMAPDGREWVKVRVPGRPNGRTGWAERELLGPVHHARWRIVVNRRARRMRVFYRGRLLRVFPVGVGKPSTPTPAGRFWIDERFKLSNPRNPYWPYALGTSDYSSLPNWPGEGVIGIHGPFGEPQKIPGDPSHGCIRMLSRDISWLGPRVTLGTPVVVE